MVPPELGKKSGSSSRLMPLLLEGRRFSAFWLRRAEPSAPLGVLADGDDVGKCSGEEAKLSIVKGRYEMSASLKEQLAFLIGASMTYLQGSSAVASRWKLGS